MMPRVKIRAIGMTIIWAILCFAFITLILIQVLPSTTAVIKVENGVYLPGGSEMNSKDDANNRRTKGFLADILNRNSQRLLEAAEKPSIVNKFADDKFNDLNLKPTKMSYPKAEKAKIDSLNIHNHPEENWQRFQNKIVS